MKINLKIQSNYQKKNKKKIKMINNNKIIMSNKIKTNHQNFK